MSVFTALLQIEASPQLSLSSLNLVYSFFLTYTLKQDTKKCCGSKIELCRTKLEIRGANDVSEGRSKYSNVIYPLHTIYPSLAIYPLTAVSECIQSCFCSIRPLTPSHHLSPSSISSALHFGPGSNLSRLGPLSNKAFDSRKEGLS